MDPVKLIKKYYLPDSAVFNTLINHGILVMKKCLKIAGEVSYLKPDFLFLEEAAMLHDIGIIFTYAPDIGCYGERDYICHGYLGRELLEREGLPSHALVCERHIGVGLSINEIQLYDLPIPVREMLPVSIEEKIICYADKFFSKDSPGLEKEVEEVRKEFGKYGTEVLKRFDEMASLFGSSSGAAQ